MNNELEQFALQSLQAEKFPNDRHVFKEYKCPECGFVPLQLTFEYHTEGTKEDFKGKIFAQCTQCNKTFEAFSFTGDHRKKEKEEKAICECGENAFFTGELERFEDDEDMPGGFFDEGVIVGQCSHCGQKQDFVYTD